MLSALDSLLSSSTTTTSGDIYNQLNLLGLAETRRLASHSRLASAIQPLTTTLDTMHVVLDRVNTAVDRMTSDLADVTHATAKLTSRTLALKQERYVNWDWIHVRHYTHIKRDQAGIREMIAKVFSEKYTLSGRAHNLQVNILLVDKEVSALSTVSEDFFLALSNLHRISDESKALLSSDNPMAGYFKCIFTS